jgi:hypothetical protein
LLLAGSRCRWSWLMLLADAPGRLPWPTVLADGPGRFPWPFGFPTVLAGSLAAAPGRSSWPLAGRLACGLTWPSRVTLHHSDRAGFPRRPGRFPTALACFFLASRTGFRGRLAFCGQPGRTMPTVLAVSRYPHHSNCQADSLLMQALSPVKRFASLIWVSYIATLRNCGTG